MNNRKLAITLALLTTCVATAMGQATRPGGPGPESAAEARDWRYVLTVHEIARADDDERLTRLLTDNPDRTKARTSDGRTPVHAAAEAGAIKALRVLARAGADLDVADARGRTALSVAASLDFMTTVKTLAELGADVNKDAVVEGSAGTAGGGGGGAGALPPVIIAARSGYTDLLKVLLDARADLNRRGRDGSYALTSAAAAGNWQTVSLLVERGADVNVQDPQGVTVLLYATEHGQEALIRTLLDKGADPRIQDSRGRAPLSVTQSPTLWKLLVDKGADVNVVVGGTGGGSTPLQYFIAQGNAELLKTWLTFKPDPLTPDREGRTAKELAKRALAAEQWSLPRREIVRLIEEYQNRYAAQQDAGG
jgi:ankyrin repeat protein